VLETVILAAVRYDVKLGEAVGAEHRLRVLESRMLWQIFGPKREEVARGWRKLLIEWLHVFHPLSNIIAVIKSRSVR
jgi:hypothetical protein